MRDSSPSNRLKGFQRFNLATEVGLALLTPAFGFGIGKAVFMDHVGWIPGMVLAGVASVATLIIVSLLCAVGPFLDGGLLKVHALTCPILFNAILLIVSVLTLTPARAVEAQPERAQIVLFWTEPKVLLGLATVQALILWLMILRRSKPGVPTEPPNAS